MADPALTEFTAEPNLSSITQGPDGAMWAAGNTGTIGRMAPDGSYQAFPMPGASDVAGGIAAGPDGNIWVTNQTADEVDRFNTSGTLTGQFAIPTGSAQPAGITTGPDGALWFAEQIFGGDKIGRVTTSGTVTEPGTASAFAGLASIVTGPDGNLWLTESSNDQIARLTTAGGAATEFPAAGGSHPDTITVGPDGALWFTEPGTGAIGRITTAGSITETPAPTGSANPRGIAFLQGNGWFADNDSSAFNYGRFDPAAPATSAVNFSTTSDTAGLAAGPDCTLWATEPAIGKIARIKPENCPQPPAPPQPPKTDPPPPPGVPPPVVGKSAVASVVSGTVLIRVPGSDRYVAFTGDRNIPVGSVIDATHGRVHLVFATDANGGTREGDFYGGAFVIHQAQANNAVSELQLARGSFGQCKASASKRRSRGVFAARKRKRKVRHLWGDAHGRFRTRGSHSAATVRGTKWLVEDRCDGTLTKVARGVVAVRDFTRRKTVTVRAGHSYVAPAHRH
jgi:virginiamycin B lyase